jgi:RNA polymerase sigma-70 factor (ECF subfamily)
MHRRRPQPSADDDGPWTDGYAAHRSVLARFVARFVAPHEVEDVVQEAIVRSYAASRKQTIDNPSGFMFRTARNLALNSAHRAAARLNRSMDDYLHSDAFIETSTPESECEVQQEFVAFCQAVASLPLSCRRVFIMRKIYGLSQKEIAARLRISPSTVENHITRGMSITTQYMFDRGYSVGRYASAAGLGRAEAERDEK